MLEFIALTNDTTIFIGESVWLACVGYGQPALEVSWSTNGQTLQNSSLVTIYTQPTIRAGGTFVTSILQLCGLEEPNSTLYTCAANNSRTAANATTRLTVSS